MGKYQNKKEYQNNQGLSTGQRIFRGALALIATGIATGGLVAIVHGAMASPGAREPSAPLLEDVNLFCQRQGYDVGAKAECNAGVWTWEGPNYGIVIEGNCVSGSWTSPHVIGGVWGKAATIEHYLAPDPGGKSGSFGEIDKNWSNLKLCWGEGEEPTPTPTPPNGPTATPYITPTPDGGGK